MKFLSNCPLSDEVITEYKEFLEHSKKYSESTSVPHLQCVALSGSKELENNYSFFTESKRKKFTADLLASFLGECFALVAVLEKGILNSAYHHSRSVVELLVTYNWVFHKESKVDKKIDRYFAYREMKKFIEYEKSQDENSTVPEPNLSEDKIDEWKKMTDYWSNLFDVEKDELKDTTSWHPKTSYVTMLDIFPPQDYLKRGYEYFSHMTHLSPMKSDFGFDSIIGIPNNDKRSEAIRILIKISLSASVNLYNLIEEKVGFNSKVKFPPIE